MNKNGQLQEVDARATLAAMTATGEIDKYLYSYKTNGQTVRDLNNEGINRLALACGVSIEDVEIAEETDEYFTVKAVAVNPDGMKHFGLAREYKKNQQGYPNTYALANATSKAQRNAKKGLLPMAEVRDVIEKAGR